MAVFPPRSDQAIAFTCDTCSIFSLLLVAFVGLSQCRIFRHGRDKPGLLVVGSFVCYQILLAEVLYAP